MLIRLTSALPPAMAVAWSILAATGLKAQTPTWSNGIVDYGLDSSNVFCAVSHNTAGETVGFWRDGSDTSAVYKLVKWNGTSWGLLGSFAVTDSLAGSSSNDDVSLAVDSAGGYHVAFRLNDNSANLTAGKRVVMYGYSSTGSAWTFKDVWRTDSSPSGFYNTDDPQVRVDSNDRPHIAFRYTDANSSRYYAIRHHYFNGTVWTGEQAYGQSGGAASNNELTKFSYQIDHDDKSHLAIVVESNGSGTDGSLAYLNNTSGSWSSLNILAAGATSNAAAVNVSMVVDSQKKIHIARQDLARALHYHTNASGSFASSQIGAAGSGALDHGSFALNSADHLFLGYNASPTTTNTGAVSYAYLSKGASSWSTGSIFTGNGNTMRFWSADLDDDGDATILFDHFSGTGSPGTGNPRQSHYAKASIAALASASVPAAPTSLIATAGDGEVSVAFTAGADGGSAITNYEFSTNDGNSWTAFDPAVTASPAVISGLTNGTAYSLRLRAVNAAGNGAASDAVSATPRTLPSAPTSLVATAGDGQVSVAFTAGADGGSAITNYEFSMNDGNSWTAFDPAVSASPAVISSLTNGTAYSLRLRAVNAAGNGAASDAVSATPRTTPSAPTALVATAGDGEVSVAFTAGADGGSAITNYEFSTNDGTSWTAFNPAVTASPAVIGGLTNGASYSIRLRSVNTAGSSSASDAVSATPVDPPIVFRAASKAAGTTSISVAKLTSRAGSVLGTTVSIASVAATSEQGATATLSGSAIQYTTPVDFSGVDRFRVTFTSSTGDIVGLVEMTTAAPSHLVNPARLTPLSSGRMGIQFSGIPGVAYQLQRSTDLTSWTTIATITAGSRGEIDFIDDDPPVPSGFYRLFKP